MYVPTNTCIFLHLFALTQIQVLWFKDDSFALGFFTFDLSVIMTRVISAATHSVNDDCCRGVCVFTLSFDQARCEAVSGKRKIDYVMVLIYSDM